jgi:imidazolonepropionase-like amidohydrolase
MSARVRWESVVAIPIRNGRLARPSMHSMRWLIALFSVMPGFAAGCDQSPLLVRNVSVWNGRSLVPARDVLVRDGRIVDIRRSRDDRESAGARVIDGTGNTLLPGLLDMHLHFVIPGLPKGIDASSISGKQLLRSGVTGGRLHLAPLADAAVIKQRGQDPCSPSPRIQAGGYGITGGAPKVNSPEFTGVLNPEDAAEKVQRIARAGLDWVAIHNIGRFSATERDAILDAARRSGLRVFSSVATAAELRASLDLAIDTLDYIDISPDPQYAPELLAKLRKKKGVALAPLVGMFERYDAYRVNPRLLDDPRLYEFLAPDAAAAVRDQAKHDLLKNRYVLESDKFRASLRPKLLELAATRLPMAIATDVGSAAHLHQGAIWWEMETWRRYGIPVEQVLRSATVVPAGILGFRDSGRIARGARADLVLYRGNVLQGAFDGSRVIAVAKAGVWFADGVTVTGSVSSRPDDR